MPLQVVVSSLSLARQLWRYGEPELAAEARRLRAPKLLELGRRAGDLQTSGQGDELWPDGPKADKALVLAAIEMLEGKARPAQRTRRLPESRLPAELQATEQELWAQANEVAMEQFRESLRRQKN